MAGEDDSRDRATDRADFGPPTADFGPPAGEFGPPVSAFGPPTGEMPIATGDDSGPERSERSWRPAGEPAAPPAVPPPPPQYRAPDSSTPAPPIGTDNGAPAFRPAPDPFGPELTPLDYRPPAMPPEADHSPVRYRPADETVRGPGADETVRYPSGPATPSTPESEPAPARPRSPLDWDSRGPLEPAPEPASGAGPRPVSGGLSWDSDPIAQKLTPQTVATALSPNRRANPVVVRIAVAAAVVVVLALLLVGGVMLTGGGDEPAPTANPESGAGVFTCESSSEGTVTTGNGEGDTTSGAGAILGFQHAYYTDRDAMKAHTFVTPNANVLPPVELQKVIDEEIPRGTAFCVRIMETGSDRYKAEITEVRPDGERKVYWQGVTVANESGKVLIKLIEPYK